jgi:hypothetical protein
MKWELNEFPLNNKLLFFFPFERWKKIERERNFQSERTLFSLKRRQKATKMFHNGVHLNMEHEIPFIQTFSNKPWRNACS